MVGQIPSALALVHPGMSSEDFSRLKADPLFLMKECSVCENCALVYHRFATALIEGSTQGHALALIAGKKAQKRARKQLHPIEKAEGSRRARMLARKAAEESMTMNPGYRQQTLPGRASAPSLLPGGSAVKSNWDASGPALPQTISASSFAQAFQDQSVGDATFFAELSSNPNLHSHHALKHMLQQSLLDSSPSSPNRGRTADRAHSRGNNGVTLSPIRHTSRSALSSPGGSDVDRTRSRVNEWRTNSSAKAAIISEVLSGGMEGSASDGLLALLPKTKSDRPPFVTREGPGLAEDTGLLRTLSTSMHVGSAAVSRSALARATGIESSFGDPLGLGSAEARLVSALDPSEFRKNQDPSGSISEVLSNIRKLQGKNPYSLRLPEPKNWEKPRPMNRTRRSTLSRTRSQQSAAASAADTLEAPEDGIGLRPVEEYLKMSREPLPMPASLRNAQARERQRATKRSQAEASESDSSPSPKPAASPSKPKPRRRVGGPGSPSKAAKARPSQGSSDNAEGSRPASRPLPATDAESYAKFLEDTIEDVKRQV